VNDAALGQALPARIAVGAAQHLGFLLERHEVRDECRAGHAQRRRVAHGRTPQVLLLLFHCHFSVLAATPAASAAAGATSAAKALGLLRELHPQLAPAE
jgi:hypothetical protein